MFQRINRTTWTFRLGPLFVFRRNGLDDSPDFAIHIGALSLRWHRFT